MVGQVRKQDLRTRTSDISSSTQISAATLTELSSKKRLTQITKWAKCELRMLTSRRIFTIYK